MTEGGKTLPVFFSGNEHNNTNLKLQAMVFKVIPEEKQQLLEEKDADNARKVLCNHSLSGFEN